jgi:hypothetical protein
VKKYIAAVLAAFLLLSSFPVRPALGAEISSERLSALQAQAEQQGLTVVYTGVVTKSVALRESPSKDSARLGALSEGERVAISDYDTQWLHVVSETHGTGYILRQYCVDITPVDPSTTLPYGAVVHHYTAVVAQDTAIYKDPNESGDAYCNLTAGSLFSFWYMEDGWALTPYWRELGYVPMDKLTSLTPVSPTVDYAQSGDMLSVFTSFYSTKDTELNRGRMVNIDVACDYISQVMQPGESWSFNNVAGPYKKARGYQAAPVLIDGTTVPGYGGGTCQVSSTLYNTLLLLPHNMTILQRRPHGPGGAKYLPHGVDAAVGNESLDLVFRNDFDFPIRIRATAKDGALCIAIIKE